MRGLEGKGVLVAGASRGIGEAAARRFLEEGCRVFICARGAAGVEETVRELGALGLGEVGGTAADVSDPEAVEHLVDAAERFLGEFAPVAVRILADNVAGMVQLAAFCAFIGVHLFHVFFLPYFVVKIVATTLLPNPPKFTASPVFAPST